MADENFRPRKNQPQQDEDQNEALQRINQMRSQVNQEELEDAPQGSAAYNQQPTPQRAVPPQALPQGTFPIQGNVPPAFQAALNAAKNSGGSPERVEQNLSGNAPKRGFQMSGGGESPAPQQQQPQRSNLSSSGSGHLKELLESLRGSTAVYEEIELPSKGRFYDDSNGPSSGVVSIRPMTGEEEQILATPRFVRKGQAINMIFQKCLKEKYNVDQLLTVDRTYLLIYLRGISYSPEYDVEIKCPECEKKFSTSINLNDLYVEACPDEFGPDLQDVLPNTKLPFSYRLSTGRDEQEIQDHRDRRIKMFGDTSADDTLIYRTAQLVHEIDGITNKQELQVLLKNLPINDVAYIRGIINEPPFGVDTNVEIVCPSCLQEFQMELPLEANFFFPRRQKRAKTQA